MYELQRLRQAEKQSAKYPAGNRCGSRSITFLVEICYHGMNSQRCEMYRDHGSDQKYAEYLGGG